MIKIKNGIVKKIKDNRCFGHDTKIEDISKIVVTGKRIIEIYVKDDINLVFVYYDDINNLECLTDYSFIKKYFEVSFDIEVFSKEHCYGFYVLSEKREFVEPGEMLVEGFVESETPNSKKYEEPIKIEDIIFVERVTSRVIKITLKSGDVIYWLYADRDSADIKYEEIIAAISRGGIWYTYK
jgi:hypothetical protein